MNFQYYSNSAHSPNPLGFVDINKFWKAISDPKQETKDLLSKIRDASKLGDKKLKATLKQHLYSFTPCVHVKARRAYDDIIKFTGITVLDFDKIGYAAEFKNFLFHTYGSVIGAWLSPSGLGVKAFVKIPVVNKIEEYKKYFYGLASEMEIYKGFDATTQNAVLPLFIGYDKDVLVRDDYTTWNIKGSKIGSFDSSKVVSVPAIDVSNNKKAWVVNWFKNKINDIVTDGHPQLRDSSVALGGYVGSGYINYIEALQLVFSLIDSNDYLQKGVSGYKKTAEQALKMGTTKPLTFN